MDHHCCSCLRLRGRAYSHGAPLASKRTGRTQRQNAAMKSFLLFAVVGLVFGGIALGLGFFLWSEVALVQGAAAFGLTFVPAVLTLAWALYSYRSTPELQLMASM